MEAYYEDELVTLYLGDCREITAWQSADALVTDPPYGRGWKQGSLHSREKQWAPDGCAGISGDKSTDLRDYVLSAWAGRAVCFGDLMLPPPSNTKQVLVYQKPKDAGRRGATAGIRRDLEAIYLIGSWSSGISAGRGSLFRSGAAMTSGSFGLAKRYSHPHAKPEDLCEELIGLFDPKPTLLADPFAGGGSILVAARNLGIKAIGVEIEEEFAENAAKRLSQQTLFCLPTLSVLNFYLVADYPVEVGFSESATSPSVTNRLAFSIFIRGRISGCITCVVCGHPGLLDSSGRS